MILITYASVTAQEVASEKGTKIMEVVFSSIRAWVIISEAAHENGLLSALREKSR